ncbi:hypothetical protein PGTUg99_035210 [Puccinia graminis f. sp. tritici]|uniref:Uncharacterized protein n=1 Tax=Puccinia graminis f. sp. tritici TaxID=56615 RepID=A0A5B0RG25_PUCGR|nr:hypothetical protein PGTUg99_035210 [Puccinia graminis f. sp. tritici]
MRREQGALSWSIEGVIGSAGLKTARDRESILPHAVLDWVGLATAHPPLHNHLAPLVWPFPIPPSLAILLLPSLQPEPGSLP